MEIRNAWNPRDVKSYTTERLREEFLIQGLFQPGSVNMVYSHADRIIVGAACPLKPITLEAGGILRAECFLERREMGVINIGGRGTVSVDGAEYVLDTRDGLYIGRGSKAIILKSDNPDTPAKFYFISTPAHRSCPTEKIDIGRAEPAKTGSLQGSNARTIYKYIHPQGVKSCQLVMGMTVLEPGSVWNTMPCHTHDRRMEVYLYFDMAKDAVAFHFMGEPGETRHIAVRNEEAVISPDWSVHSGCGTGSYAFIWGMAGENQAFSDMDAIPMGEIK